MGIGNTSLLIDLLNAASRHAANVSSGASQQLTVGSVYTFQALSADTWVGFGPTAAAAITDGAAGTGEFLVADAPPRIFSVSSPDVVFVGCSGGTLRIRRCAA